MSIISLQQVSLNLAGNQLLDAIDWQIQPQERIALVGRNGAGKSTLLRLLQGELIADSGQITQINGLRIASLSQEVPLAAAETVYHFLVKKLGKVGEVLTQFYELTKEDNFMALAGCQQQMDDLHAWDLLPRIEMMATKLGLNMDSAMPALSGGMKRRALLAAALIASPDILLLDEPTNHLDITTIEWLEAYLKSYSGCLVLVTHDRQFLQSIANQIIEIDRGKLHRYHCDYSCYLDRREARRLSEQKENALFDKHLNQEEEWLRTGIKARRTRNEGRVKVLKLLREQQRARREKMAKMSLLSLEVARSGNLVLEANHLHFSIAGKSIINDFSLVLSRGDKLGIIGPNGCGKTTLLRLLIGELSADKGTIRHGTALKIAYFDQLRRQLEENETLLFAVADGADYVTINGKQQHVATYLRKFLFSPEKFNQQVATLSGGERNRLLLAKLFAKPVTLLIMDEPTNDLDIETLELLEAFLTEYTGSLLLISHDRAFINQVVTSVLVYEDGQFNDYFGGYDEYCRHKKQQQQTAIAITSKRPKEEKLNYREQRELGQLPEQIELLELEIASLQQEVMETGFYEKSSQTIHAALQQLSRREKALAQLYLRWEELENKGKL